ncbi:tryptophan--tRNA ligase [Tropheryma whipplei]|uniref:tryptophan--tRNA ligase n=1 Tax=Tropheryma whipplei TaxID=2039 RepID=UPI0004BC257B|nr:tryptophan--tRNA ligase [Tropheryma whipplei]
MTSSAIRINKKPVVLSGIQPSSGMLHLGNYLGALKSFGRMQDDYATYFMLANLHSMTFPQNPEVLRENTIRIAAQCIAAGIDPAKSIVFLQSDVYQHNQLAWVLGNVCTFGEAARMTQFKDKSGKQGNISTGLFTYPILMASDILLYDSAFVPVGADQKQHLELTRTLARRFNAQYGQTFLVPQPFECSIRIYDLQDPAVKMSKSSATESGTIFLLDSPDKIVKKIMRSVTDSEDVIGYDRETKPGVSNLVVMYSCLTDCTIEQTVNIYSGKKYSVLKKDLSDILVEVCKTIATRTNELLDDKNYIRKILVTASEQARGVAQKTIDRVYEKLGVY